MGIIREVRPLTSVEYDALSAARANLLGAPGESGRGYYGAGIWRLIPVAAPGLDTWAVDDSWRLYVDPDALPGGAKGWTAANCADVLEHEINHLLREHGARLTTHAPNATGRARNIAADLEINTGLPDKSFVRTIGVLPEQRGLKTNQLAEWYLDHLPKPPSPNASGGRGNQVPTAGGQDGNATSGSDGEGDGAAVPGLGSACGSGAGNRLPGELDADDAAVDSVSDVDAELARRAVAEAVAAHVAQYGRGSVPGGVEQWSNVLLTPPKVPWQSMLRAATSRGISLARGNSDYTYSRLSRRSSGASARIILPGMFAPEPQVDAIVDTSGSVPDKELFEALSEVEGVARAANVRGERLRLILVDADVQSVSPVWDLSRVKVKGRGGTNMRVGVDFSLGLEPACDVQIILTDGDTPIPAQSPDRRVQQIWVLVGKRAAGYEERFRSAMPWADVVVAA